MISSIMEEFDEFRREVFQSINGLHSVNVADPRLDENIESDIIPQWLTAEKPVNFFVKVGPLKHWMIDISRQLYRRYVCLNSSSRGTGEKAAEEA